MMTFHFWIQQYSRHDDIYQSHGPIVWVNLLISFIPSLFCLKFSSFLWILLQFSIFLKLFLQTIYHNWQLRNISICRLSTFLMQTWSKKYKFDHFKPFAPMSKPRLYWGRKDDTCDRRNDRFYNDYSQND